MRVYIYMCVCERVPAHGPPMLSSTQGPGYVQAQPLGMSRMGRPKNCALAVRSQIQTLKAKPVVSHFPGAAEFLCAPCFPRSPANACDKMPAPSHRSLQEEVLGHVSFAFFLKGAV